MYNIKIASEKIGVTPMTLRAWERRYGLSPSSRSDGGHRLYSNDDINKLLWIKKQMAEKGVPISRAVEMLKVQEENLKVENAVKDKNQTLIDPLFNALTAFKLEQAHSIVDYSFSLYHFGKVFEDLFFPLAVKIGDKWSEGEISIAQEHFATQFLLQRCYKMMDIFPVQSHLPKGIALCPVGEHHHLGLMMFTLFLRRKALGVLYLGPNTPMDGLGELIEEQQIQYAFLSVSGCNNDQPINLFIDDLKKNYPSISVVLGGRGTKSLGVMDGVTVLENTLDSWENWFQKNVIPVEKV
ncbi:MerR family transcriptional regulator [Bacillus carboniphilus]|uniref:MerR family transcriptional regulator n=1 Tax=Bacillus carboniphilus TaxID=86663 RepID=A0ABY9JVC0_9BACI|nr:MerR family transcriptional regulator [Bacillus carboniphilus]WLR42683.1 MerR family transcriptional regulator [Bacillus carboniphilus]